MKSLFFMVLLCFSVGAKKSEGYRILGVFPLKARSHFMMFEALMRGLARKGHQVDVVSPFPQQKSFPNYKDIRLDADMDLLVNNMSYSHFTQMSTNVRTIISVDLGNRLCSSLGDPEMQNIIKNPPKDPPYDLVITEVFAAHCYMALGPHLNVPTIGVSSSVLYPWGHGIIANPTNLAIAPNNLINLTGRMNFWQRFYNVVNAIYSDLWFQYLTQSQDEMIKKYLGENAPGVRESERRLALVLTNSHPVLNDPKPITPALIEVGGLHVQDDGPELPQDLKDWMDKSTKGFVYFTFGSMVTIESIPEEIVRVFYRSLGKIAPIRVLIKVPNPDKMPSGMPNNFHTFPWATQFKVLKHKNVRAFLTHGGLMGGQEAIHCGVPMIVMPLFGDQFQNADRYVGKKIAVRLDFAGITEQKMDAALNEILYNPVWKNMATKFSEEFLDRPMNAMDTAIFWVEYVVRRGNDALRSRAMDLAWWQLELFDVYAVLILLTILATFLIIKFVLFVARPFSNWLLNENEKLRLNSDNKKNK